MSDFSSDPLLMHHNSYSSRALLKHAAEQEGVSALMAMHRQDTDPLRLGVADDPLQLGDSGLAPDLRPPDRVVKYIQNGLKIYRQ